MPKAGRQEHLQIQHGWLVKDLQERRWLPRPLVGILPCAPKKCADDGSSTGFMPTLLGYSIQGAAKYGFYEYFKKTYSDMAGPENAAKYKDIIYLAGSASAELIADVGLVPLETVKVRMQTTMPPFARGTLEGINKVTSTEGAGA